MKKILFSVLGVLTLFQPVFAQDVSSYEFEEIRIQPLGSANTIRIGRFAEIAKLRIQNTSKKNILFEQITFNNIGKSDLGKSLVNPVLTSSTGDPISTNFITSGRTLRFDLGDQGFLLEQGNTYIFRVMATIGYASRGDSIQLEIKESEDISFRDKSSGFGVPHNGEQVEFKVQKLSPGSIYTSRRTSYSPIRSTAYRNRTTSGRTITYERQLTPNYGIRSHEKAQFSHHRPQAYSVPKVSSRQSYAPGAKDIVFFNKSIYNNRSFTADGVFFPLDTVRSNASNGFEDTFTNLVLFINGQYQDRGSFEEQDGQIGVLFDTSLDIRDGGTHNVKVSGRISRSAENGDRLRLLLSNNNFIDIDYY